ncbi:beta-glucosidase BglX [Ferruginibacter lapsinanis]|uniref:beta-glucosidase BglX n=1 Tax=Ferruginibacter lapsinanis TaxID=563172 RepID=UPI001E51B895|nr:beta-glucosidase BglX [Ferruginibacter lapsinanis]UEG48829.1 beta-glucosidase BglX [Ferruginibacter lapsinanis]
MSSKKPVIFLSVFFCTITFLSYGQQSAAPTNAYTSVKNIEARVDSVLKLMTLEEKVGQMNQYNGFWDATGPAPKEGNAQLKYQHLTKGLVGAILNVRGVTEVRKLQEIAVKQTRLGIPLLFGSDVIHGYKTLFPIPLGESASWDLEAIERSARVAAIEASAVGINWTFAPMVDITRDARWGRVMEGAGEDPYLGSIIGATRIKGFQGTDLAASNTIIASVKHLAAYGFAEAGRDYNTADVGTSTLYNIILPPFKAAVDANVRTVMNSFNVLNGIPSTANKFLQRDILKGKWKFDGFVVSDWSSGAEMIDHGFAKDLSQVTELSVNAGSDMDMESYAYVKYLQGLVESGKVDIALVDDAVKRILRVKFELGLFDDPYKYCDLKKEKELIYHPDHLAAALDVAKKSIVLLKNDKQLLPLKKTQKNIAIIGALANDKNSPLGGWRIGSDDSSAVSFLEGFKKYTNNFKYSKGADVITAPIAFAVEASVNETDKSGFKAAIELAKKSSVVIMVLGEQGFQTGEGRSRTKLDLPGVQQQLLEEVYKVNKNIILVLMNGRPLAIPWAAEHIPAIVEAWQLGTETGNAIAQVLFGDYNPGGKLTMSFPRSVGQVPIYYNHYNTGRPGPKKEVFWSHYGDESNQPLYPFGFGLSYTSFDYSGLHIDAADQSKIKVSITVKNTGKVSGEEVVQLYIHDKVASVVRPVKELKGFKKIKLEPGESRQVAFVLTDAELGFFNNEGQFIVEPGDFDILVGTNSQQGVSGSFTRR